MIFKTLVILLIIIGFLLVFMAILGFTNNFLAAIIALVVGIDFINDGVKKLKLCKR